jgi:hypothetical protein
VLPDPLRGLAPPRFDHLRLGLVVHAGDDPEQAGVGAGIAVGIILRVPVVDRRVVPPSEADEFLHRGLGVLGLGEARDIAEWIQPPVSRRIVHSSASR